MAPQQFDMMSSANQNGKKCGNDGNSVANTPASTPVTSCPNVNGDSVTQMVLPTNNNAPKFGECYTVER